MKVDDCIMVLTDELTIGQRYIRKYLKTHLIPMNGLSSKTLSIIAILVKSGSVAPFIIFVLLPLQYI